MINNDGWPSGEMANTLVLGTSDFGLVGSSPTSATSIMNLLLTNIIKGCIILI